MKHCATIFLCMSLTACASPPASVSDSPPASELTTPTTLSKADEAAIREGVKRNLKDPDSARFGQMRAGTDAKGTTTVCLMVNAKNSYGGYTGEKPHIGLLFKDRKPPVFALVPGTADTARFRDEVVSQMCADKGLAL
jgi:hypothetical protein